MLLSIKEMEVRKLKFAETWQPGEFDFEEPGITQSSPLRAEGTAELLAHTGGEVRVQGKVETDLQTECDRCLALSQYHVDNTFDLFYKPAEVMEGKDEVALDEGEAEIAFYELPGLDLEQILREQVLLQIPMQRVCKPDCKGICPICGANRNETACNCEAHPTDDRWRALEKVHIV
jgi:uncharacterized protein